MSWTTSIQASSHIQGSYDRTWKARAILILCMFGFVSGLTQSSSPFCLQQSQEKLRQAHTSTEQFDALLELGDCWRKMNIDSMAHYYADAKVLAAELGDQEKLAKIDLKFATLFILKQELDTAEKILSSLLPDFMEKQDSLSVYKVYLAYSDIYRYQQLDSLYANSLDSLQRYIPHHRYDLYLNYINRKGIRYILLGDDTQAIEAYLEGLHFIQQSTLFPEKYSKDDLSKFEEHSAHITHNLGLIYLNYRSDSLEIAESYFQKSKIYAKKTGQYQLEANSLNNLGLLYKSMTKDSLTITCFLQALELNKVLQNKNEMAGVYCNLGSFYVEKKNYEKADFYLRNGWEIIQAYPSNRNYNLIRSNIASVELHTGSPQKASKLFLDSYESGLQSKNPDVFLPALNGLVASQKKLGNFRHALEYREEYFRLRDSIQGLESKKEIAALESNFELQEAEINNQLLKKEQVLQDIRLQQQKRLLFWGGIILVLIALMTVYMYSLFRKYKHTSDQLAAQSEDLREAKLSAEASARFKSEFLSVMSHEIRTPMNGVIGTLDLLSSTSLDEEQTDLIQTIDRSADSLMHIINDILDISKIEAGKMAIESIPFNLSRTVSDVQNLFANRAQSKGLLLKTEIDPEVPSWMKGDPMRIKQVISNLVSNAIKFTEEGFVNIQVKRRSGNQEGVDVSFGLEIRVQDSGEGIPKEKQDKLFKAFSQTDTSTARLHGGTGLGLAICSNLIELMGGHIWVESELGKGSVFAFFIQLLPHKDVQPEKASQHSLSVTDSDKEMASLYPLKLLVAEDNLINQKLISRMLKKLGYTMDLANDGQEALGMARSQPYDLILMDMRMPKMDGLESAQKILSDPLIVHKPFIVSSSANAMHEDKMACEDVGMESIHLTKPFKIEQLEGVLFHYSRLVQERSSLKLDTNI